MKIVKENTELLDRMVGLSMEKMLPQRKAKLYAFIAGKQKLIETITYKAGGFSVMRRYRSKFYPLWEEAIKGK